MKEDNTEDFIFTIAIPTYKRPDLLFLALDSAVKQSYKGEYEIIVVDNCSEKPFVDEVDKVINLLSKIKKIYLYRNLNNLGMFGNWNQCLKKARGKYISILNDDDLLDNKFVENVMKDIRKSKMIIYNYEILSANKSKARIGGNLRNLIEKFNLIKKEEISIPKLIFRNPSNGSLGVVLNRKKAILIGGYESQYYPASDYYFNYKYIEKYGGVFINKKLTKYRLSVNESLKKESLIKFVSLDFKLRKKIYLKYLGSKSFFQVF